MAWLPDGEKSLKIRLYVSTKYTNVTDRQADGRTDDTALRHKGGSFPKEHRRSAHLPFVGR